MTGFLISATIVMAAAITITLVLDIRSSRHLAALEQAESRALRRLLEA